MNGGRTSKYRWVIAALVALALAAPGVRGETADADLAQSRHPIDRSAPANARSPFTTQGLFRWLSVGCVGAMGVALFAARTGLKRDSDLGWVDPRAQPCAAWAPPCDVRRAHG